MLTRRAWLTACLGLALPRPARAVALRLLVPAYFYPAGNGAENWARLIASGRKASILAIANPASGPGERVDHLYTGVLTRAAREGITLLGYISTNYAKRNAAEVEADLRRWKAFYPRVRGVFFDEQASDV